MIRRVTVSLAGVVVLLGLTPSMAQATENFSFEIPNTGYFQEGVIKEVPTPENLHEARCEVTATAVNNDSTRPGTNLTVASNGSSVVLRDVEREAGAVVTVAGGVLTLNGTITVSVEFGPEKAFSGGLTVSFSCEPVEEPEPEPTPTHTPPPVTTSNNGNGNNHHHKPKPDNETHLGTAVHEHGKAQRYGGTAMTGTREEVIRWCVIMIVALLITAALSFTAARKRARA